MGKKNDTYFISKILEEINFIGENLCNLSYEQFKSNVFLSDSVCFRFIQISELSERLSTEFMQIHGEIPWHKMFGLRNRIVHDYGNVDLNTVYFTAKNDLPLLSKKLEEILD